MDQATVERRPNLDATGSAPVLVSTKAPVP
jgi:hypothetical protein